MFDIFTLMNNEPGFENEQEQNDYNGTFSDETPLWEQIDGGNDHVEDENFCHDLDDSMDGDFDSGMASAGFGMDEDYNHYSYDEGGFGDE